MENGKRIARNIIWNTVGSLYYLGCQWLLSVLVIRFFENESEAYEAAGILSLCTSITGVFFIIALFNVKNYQVTEGKGLFCDGDFVFHRILTSILAFVSAAGFLIIRGYDRYVTMCVLSYMMLKCIEAMLDVYHGIAQKAWRLDVAGRSFIIRGTLLLVVFALSVKISGNLLISIILMTLACIFPALLYDVRVISKLREIRIRADFKKALRLTKECLPLVLYGICINSIMPTARLVLEFYHEKRVLGYYATVASIALLVQSLTSFIFSPLIGLFSDSYERNDKKAIRHLFIKLTIMLLGVTAASILASFAIIRLDILAYVFDEGIRPYVYLLYPTVIASCLTALAWLLGMILVVMKDMRTLFLGSLSGLIFCTALAFMTIEKTVLFGTNLATISGLLLVCIIYLVRFIRYMVSDDLTHIKEKNDE